MYYDVSLIL